MRTKEEVLNHFDIKKLEKFMVKRIKDNKKEMEIRKEEAKEEKNSFKDIMEHIDKCIKIVEKQEYDLETKRLRNEN